MGVAYRARRGLWGKQIDGIERGPRVWIMSGNIAGRRDARE